MSEIEKCPGCGIMCPKYNDVTHEYLGASAGCWAIYGEVLAREYSDFRYIKGHQYTVDAYSVQHPGQPERRTIQSIATHLISLYAAFELKMRPEKMPQLRKKAADSEIVFFWLEPPEDMGDLTILDIHAAEDFLAHNRLVEQWAQQMWRIWQPHHSQIGEWCSLLM